MKIGLIIPTRGDRPQFRAHCQYLIEQQTVQPDEVFFVDEPPRSAAKDITYRYRIGYNHYRNRSFTVLFLWEEDDYYAPAYIEQQLSAWNDAGRPDLFGMRRTEYYHIGAFAHFTFHHEQRSSAMNTLIRPDLNFDWCPDNEEYTDIHLYRTLPYKLWLPTIAGRRSLCEVKIITVKLKTFFVNM